MNNPKITPYLEEQKKKLQELRKKSFKNTFDQTKIKAVQFRISQHKG